MKKQGRHTLIKWGTLILLAIFAIAYYLISEPGTIKRSKLSFLMNDTSGIYEISFGYPDENILLEKTGNGWLLNNTFPASSKKIVQLYNVLLRIDVKAPVSARYEKDILTQINLNGLKVSIKYHDTNDKTFYLCTDTIHNSGIYALSIESEQPYLITLPGYENRNIVNFFITDVDYWTSNILINIPPAQIEKLSLQYTEEPLKSFSIEKYEDKYTLTGKNNQTINFNNEALGFYLSSFQGIKYKLKHNSVPSTLINPKVPFAKLSFSTTNGKNGSLWFYDKNIETDKKKDTYQLYIYKEKLGEYYLVDYYTIDPILKEIEYFNEKKIN